MVTTGRAGGEGGRRTTTLHAFICGATALSILVPLAILFLRMLGVARWRDLWGACWLAAGAWAVVGIVWVVGVR